MAKRSLQVHEEYLQKANSAFNVLGLTQENFAETRLNISRSTFCKFLTGKSIDRENFVKICQALKLDCEEITGIKEGRVGIAHPTESTKSKEATENIDIKALVTQLRQQVKADIEIRCGTMRILDMSQPIELGKIYTQVNILEKIISRRRKDITELLQNCNLEDFNRFNFGAIREERILGKEAVSKYKKLLILGKPGAGKTTFLKHLAIQCNRDEFQGDLVPFFVTLKLTFRRKI
ncbi:NACHT domain family protein (fragment) [Hyella patelloides LEGE 07179]|uniref:NACHT domain family protein n=2 Tax=Hyella TaxID=945733 RepID=A0A563VMY8_9CYAN